MDWPTILSIVAALGGLEFLKWIFNRRNDVRKQNADLRDQEQTAHEKQIERYEARLLQRDTKVDAIYKELRDEQKQNLELLETINKLELEKELLTLQKCEVRGCTLRKPPGIY